jgi:PAS domain S-box-containing protein
MAGTNIDPNPPKNSLVSLGSRESTDTSSQPEKGEVQDFRFFIEQAPAALAMFDNDMRYMAVSTRWIEAFQLPSNLLGRSHYETFPETPERWKSVHRRALAGETLREEEDSFSRQDGTVQWIKWEVRPWRNLSGVIGGILIYSEDITERKTTERALRARERELSLIFSNVSDVLFHLAIEPDGNYRFAAVNEAFLSATGLQTNQVVGRTVREVIPEPSCSMVLAKYREAIQSRKTVRWEETTDYSTGQKTGIVSVTPVYDESGTATHLIGGVHDITERKRAEEQLRLVADHMPALITYIDRHLVYRFVNAAYTDWFGQPMNDINGSHMREVLGKEIFEQRKPHIQKVLTGETASFEGVTRHHTAGLRDTEITYIPDQTASGEVQGFYAFIHDITERKQEARNLRQAEERFRLAAANEVVTLYEQDTELRYTWLYPLTPFCEKSIGKSDEDLLPNEDGRLLAQYKREVLKTGISQRREVRVSSSRREVKFFDLIISAKRDESGAITGIAGAALDITDRKRADEANSRLVAIVESSEDAILSKDLQGVITTWNSGAERMFGYAAIEAIGQPVNILVPATLQQEEQEILNRIRQGDRVTAYETVRRRKDGSLLDVSLSVSPLKDAQGTIVGASKIARNISERKRHEAALEEAKEHLSKANVELEKRVEERTTQLTEINGQLEAFVYSIAHDLRAPLRSMQAFSTMLLEDYAAGMDETAQNYARRIVRAAESMDTLVLDLLAYGRAARAEIVLEPVNVAEAWTSALAQHEHAIRGKNARIEVAPELPGVLAHEPTFIQVLANLLGNAIKFVPPGTTPHVRLSAESTGEKIRLLVADNGIGIPPQYQDRIFRVFERLNGKDYAGTGIGLSIVRKGIERMGGTVGVESAPGTGSRFWVELPKA